MHFLAYTDSVLGSRCGPKLIQTSDAKVSVVNKFSYTQEGWQCPFLSWSRRLLLPFCQRIRINCLSFYSSFQERHSIYMERRSLKKNFDTPKHTLTNTSVFTFPNYHFPFTIYINASGICIGAVPMQQGDGQLPQIKAYACRFLSPAESEYSVTHLKVLAVIWALKNFRDSIFGNGITVYTDYKAVTNLSLEQKPHWLSCQVVPRISRI